MQKPCKSSIKNKSLSNQSIYLILNFLICVVVKILSLQSNALGPLLVLCGIVFYYVSREKAFAIIVYHVLTLIAVLTALYGVGMIYLGMTTAPRYLQFKTLCYTYIVLGMYHICMSIYLFRRRS